MTTFLHGGAHPVELEMAPDGSLLYVNLSGGSIARITYNRLTAAATASPTSGVAPLTVQLDGTESTGAGLTYAWDLDGDGQFGDATGASPTHAFPAGTYTVRLRVTDASGATALSAPLTISSADAPPTAPAGAAPAAVPGAAPTAPTTPNGGQAVAVARRKQRVVRRHLPVVARADGTVRLRVYCPSPVACAASIAVRAVTGGPALAQARIRVPAKRTRTVRLRLTAAARRRLARHGRLRVISVLKLVPAHRTAQRVDTIFTLRSPAARR